MILICVSNSEKLMGILSHHFHIESCKDGDRSQGWPEGSFSLATTPRWREAYYSLPWIAPLDPWSIPYNAEC